MIDSLFKALAAGLSIWESKEKTKYVDQLMSLKKDYYAEWNKDPAIRSDAVLDDIKLKLRILCDAFSTGVIGKDSAPKP